MLFQTLHIPRVYEELPSELSRKHEACSTLTDILGEMAENCVILADENELFYHEIINVIRSKWPPQHIKRALERIDRLRDRFVPVSMRQASTLPACTSTTCKIAFDIFHTINTIDLVLALGDCPNCGLLRRITTVEKFHGSDFQKKRKTDQEIILKEREWDKLLFSKLIWEPLFCHTKTVDFVDRNIGWFMKRQGEIPIGLSDNYERGLNWILQCYADSKQGKPEHVFRIICGLGWREVSKRPVAAREVLKKWAQEKSESLKITVEVDVRKEEKDTQKTMPHERYMFTDKINLEIGRGADIVCEDDNFVRAGRISLCNKPQIVRDQINNCELA